MFCFTRKAIGRWQGERMFEEVRKFPAPSLTIEPNGSSFSSALLGGDQRVQPFAWRNLPTHSAVMAKKRSTICQGIVGPLQRFEHYSHSDLTAAFWWYCEVRSQECHAAVRPPPNWQVQNLQAMLEHMHRCEAEAVIITKGYVGAVQQVLSSSRRLLFPPRTWLNDSRKRK